MSKSKDELIQDSIPFVYFIINKYYPTFRYDEDVIQAGMLGLVISANKYNAKKGKFSTFAGVVIKNSIANELKARMKEPTISLDAMIEGGFQW